MDNLKGDLETNLQSNLRVPKFPLILFENLGNVLIDITNLNLFSYSLYLPL